MKSRSVEKNVATGLALSSPKSSGARKNVLGPLRGKSPAIGAPSDEVVMEEAGRAVAFSPSPR